MKIATGEIVEDANSIFLESAAAELGRKGAKREPEFWIARDIHKLPDWPL